MKKGFLLSLEGSEACGKTTQKALLEEYFKKNNIDYVSFREPGATAIGEKVREILLDKNYDMNYKTEVLLFNACRSEICEKLIRPALEQGKVVLLDRFYHSTLVYQGLALGKDVKEIQKIIDFATDGLKTDLTLLLNRPAEVAFKTKEQENKQDRIESRGLEYYKKLHDGFLTLAKKDRRIVVIENGSIEEMHAQIVKAFEKAYKK